MVGNFEQGVRTSVLSDFGIIRARGSDARNFLHNQLTQDVLNLPKERTRLAGYCSAKGRLYAIFHVFASTDAVYLVTRRELIDLLMKRLSMFILRAKVVLEDISSEFQIYGISAVDALHENQLQETQDGFRLGILPAWVDGVTYARELYLSRSSDVGQDTAELWNWLDIMAGLPHIERYTYEAFVPQMVNLDRIGGVNFKKGCYPGQEVVARSHYLGKLKRRMQAASLIFTDEATAQAALVKLIVGTDVYSSADVNQAAGRLVAIAPHPFILHQIDLLYEISLPLLNDEAQLSIQGVQALWQHKSLPYTLVD